MRAWLDEGLPGGSNNDENIFAAGDSHTTRMASARSRVVVCPLWTDTNNWDLLREPSKPGDPSKDVAFVGAEGTGGLPGRAIADDPQGALVQAGQGLLVVPLDLAAQVGLTRFSWRIEHRDLVTDL